MGLLYSRRLPLAPAAVSPTSAANDTAPSLGHPTSEQAAAPQLALVIPLDGVTLDLHRLSRGECLKVAKSCDRSRCRYHLPGNPVPASSTRPETRPYFCALDVADDFPNGLAPEYVAALLGATEGEVQRLERGVRKKEPEAWRELRQAFKDKPAAPPEPGDPHDELSALLGRPGKARDGF